MLNEQAAWEKFDPQQYLDVNYDYLRSDDARIVEVFTNFIKELPTELISVDIGAGPNLYPALLMSTHARSIMLIERATTNVAWLNRHLKEIEAPDRWWPYVNHAGVCIDKDQYIVLWKRMKAITEVREGNIFALPKYCWDLATMFFVAESLTDNLEEFNLAVRSYFESIRYGGWFFAAFMEGSIGYTVGNIRYPAVSIHISEIEVIAKQYCSSASFVRIPLENNPVRLGYSGMILIKGRIDKS